MRSVLAREIQVPSRGAFLQAAVGLGRQVWPLAVLLTIATLIRAIPLDATSLWGDEIGQAITASQASLGGVLQAVRAHAADAPLDFLGTRFGMALWPDPTIGPRLWPLFCGIATVLAAERATTAWYGRKAGIIAAALAVTSPMLAYYSTEARPYALTSLLAFAYLTALAHRSRVALTVVTAAGVLASYPFALLTAVGGVHLTARHRWSALVAQMLGYLALLPWLWFALPMQLGRIFNYPTPGLRDSLVAVLQAFTTPGIGAVAWVAVALALYLVAVALRHHRDGWWLAAMVVFVVAAMYVVVRHDGYFWAPRHVIVALAPFLVLLSAGIAAQRRPALVTATWTAIAVPSLIVVLTNHWLVRNDFRGAAAWLSTHPGPVAVAPAVVQAFLAYYDPAIGSRVVAPGEDRAVYRVTVGAVGPLQPGWTRLQWDGLVIDQRPPN